MKIVAVVKNQCHARQKPAHFLNDGKWDNDPTKDLFGVATLALKGKLEKPKRLSIYSEDSR